MLAFATASALVLAIPFAATVRAEPAATGFVYTADEFGNTVSRIDLTTEKIDIVPVPITPHNVQFVSEKIWCWRWACRSPAKLKTLMRPMGLAMAATDMVMPLSQAN